MAIFEVCTNCGRNIRAKEKYAGKRVKCPRCKRPVELPLPEMEPSDEIDFGSLAAMEQAAQAVSPPPQPDVSIGETEPGWFRLTEQPGYGHTRSVWRPPAKGPGWNATRWGISLIYWGSLVHVLVFAASLAAALTGLVLLLFLSLTIAAAETPGAFWGSAILIGIIASLMTRVLYHVGSAILVFFGDYIREILGFVLLVVAMLVAAVFAGERTAGLVGAVGAIVDVGAALGIVSGSVLCLAVPGQSTAKPLAVAYVGSLFAAIVGAVVLGLSGAAVGELEAHISEPTLAVAVGTAIILFPAAQAFFALFIRQLARYFRDEDLPRQCLFYLGFHIAAILGALAVFGKLIRTEPADGNVGTLVFCIFLLTGVVLADSVWFVKLVSVARYLIR